MENGSESLPVIPVEWAVSDEQIPYPDAAAAMAARAHAIHQGVAPECVWLLEHPPLYTAGVRAQASDLLQPDRFPVFKSERGGEFTYHGPGQRVAYVMLDLTQRGRDVRRFVNTLEEWIIQTLGAFNVTGERRSGRVGVWVDRTQSGGPRRDDKIAAIGVRVRKWVTFHGIALNVDPDLSHFEGITPCGIAEEGLGVTSLVDLGLPVTLMDVDIALRRAFEEAFSASTIDGTAPLASACALSTADPVRK